MKPIIAYRRVSSKEQGKSGLGLEAQQADNARFCAAFGFEIVADHVEIETGKGADALDRRPVLAAALADARRHKCPLLVSKIDRLTRNVHFGSGLMAEKVAFRVAAMPNADNFQLHLFLALAEQEREQISARTIAALAAAKARGVKLGNPNIQAAADREAAQAREFAAAVAPIIAPVINLSATRIARYLNAQGVKTADGKAWSHTQVIRLINRLKGANENAA
jgi:DNA invertase Pin-like site-specific DNA recombinase